MSDEVKNIPVVMDDSSMKEIGRASIQENTIIFEISQQMIVDFYRSMAEDGLLIALKLGGVLKAGNPSFRKLETS